MPHYLCHEQPDLLEFETSVIASRPGAVVLGRSALHPGGGGQVSDAATLTHAHGAVRITGVAPEDGMLWHLLDEPLELHGDVHWRSTRPGAPPSPNSTRPRIYSTPLSTSASPVRS